MKPLETLITPRLELPRFDPTDPRLPPYVALRLEVFGTIHGDSKPLVVRSLTIVWKRSKDLWYVTNNSPRGSNTHVGSHTRAGLTSALFGETHAISYKVDSFQLTRMGRLDTYGALMYGANQNLLHWFQNTAKAMRLGSALVASTRGSDRPTPHAMRGGRRFTAAEWMAMRKMFTNRKLQSLVESIADAATHRNERDLVDELRDNWDYPKYREATNLLLRNLRDDFNACLTRCECGHVEHDDDQYVTAGGTTYCRECGHDELEYVGGEYHHRDDLYYWESDGEYHFDPEPEDDEDEDCYLLQGWGTSCSHLDHDKSFTPSPIGDFTMGVELEVEVRDTYYANRSESIRDCHDYFNDPRTLGEYAMFKRDGSLSDSRGFEIVTAARRLHDHIGMFMDWEPENLTSWSNGNCGMHVHLDSRAFTALSLGKFLMFYNDGRNMDIIRRVAGRHPLRDRQAQSFANTLDQKDCTNPAKVKKGAGTHRYRIVNLTNLSGAEQERLKQMAQRDSKGSYSTVEVRIFRGTLKKARLLAQLEFAHASVMFCRVTSWGALNESEFLKWLRANAGSYKNLAAFLNVAPPPKVDKRNGQNAPSQLTPV